MDITLGPVSATADIGTYARIAAGKADADVKVKYAATAASMNNVAKNYLGQLEGFKRIDAAGRQGLHHVAGDGRTPIKVRRIERDIGLGARTLDTRGGRSGRNHALRGHGPDAPHNGGILVEQVDRLVGRHGHGDQREQWRRPTGLHRHQHRCR